MKMHTYRNFINGEWRASQSNKTVPNINPANVDDVLGFMPQSTRQEAETAVAAAKAAAAGWSSTPAPRRAAYLMKVVQALRERQNELAQMITREEGKAILESRLEVFKAIDVFEYMAGAGRRLGGVTLPSAFNDNFAYTVRQPLGVVALITPWNFPVSIPAWKLAPALIAGNTIVFKPASDVPGSAEILVQALETADLPAGVVNLIYGAGREVGDALVEHPDVAGVSFTGSNAIGGRLYQQCAQRGARAQCEMGGKNPAVILEDANLELAVQAVIGGAFGATGQRCTAISRAVVVDRVADQFLEKLLARTAGLGIGDGLDEATFVGPAVSEDQLNSVLAYIEIGKQEGAKLLYGGYRLTEDNYAQGYFLMPTVFDQVTPTMRIAQEEIFGPVLSIMRVKDFDEAISVANDVKFGLTSVIYTNDLARSMQFVNRIETGMAHVNAPFLGGEVHLPFGGAKASGIGPREMGEAALDFYTEVKAVYFSPPQQ
jgi:acyl-CoA reductase-like NAD-dependent aldehyde dehydrogenase